MGSRAGAIAGATLHLGERESRAKRQADVAAPGRFGDDRLQAA